MDKQTFIRCWNRAVICVMYMHLFDVYVCCFVSVKCVHIHHCMCLLKPKNKIHRPTVSFCIKGIFQRNWFCLDLCVLLKNMTFCLTSTCECVLGFAKREVWPIIGSAVHLHLNRASCPLSNTMWVKWCISHDSWENLQSLACYHGNRLAGWTFGRV